MNQESRTHAEFPQFALEWHQKQLATKIRLGVFGLVLSGLITVGAFQYFLISNRYLGHAINIAGRQRMLSQRIAKDVLAIHEFGSHADWIGYDETPPPPSGIDVPEEPSPRYHTSSAADGAQRRSLRDSLHRFETEFQELLTIAEPNFQQSGAEGSRFAVTPALAAHHYRLIKAARTASSFGKAKPTAEDLAAVLSSESSFLPLMEEMVGNLESDFRQRVYTFAAMSAVVYILQIVTLLFVWRRGIAPAARRLRESAVALAEEYRAIAREAEFQTQYVRDFAHRLFERMSRLETSAEVACKCADEALSESLTVLNRRLLAARIDATEFRSFVDLELDRSGLQPEPMEWNAVLRDGVDCWRDAAESRGISIVEDYDVQAHEPVVSDPNRLRHIVASAIARSMNALDAGTIRFSSRRLSSDATSATLAWELTALGKYRKEKADAWILSYCPNERADVKSFDSVFGPGDPGFSVCSRSISMLGAKVQMKELGSVGWQIRLSVALPLESAVVASWEESSCSESPPPKAALRHRTLNS